jgi:hypothetical protein
MCQMLHYKASILDNNNKEMYTARIWELYSEWQHWYPPNPLVSRNVNVSEVGRRTCGAVMETTVLLMRMKSARNWKHLFANKCGQVLTVKSNAVEDYVFYSANDMILLFKIPGLFSWLALQLRQGFIPTMAINITESKESQGHTVCKNIKRLKYLLL